jgi:hypothetical protein
MTRLIALCLAAIALAPAARAEVYRWVDDQGRVHYSQVPPAGREAQPLTPPPPPQAAPNQDAMNRALDQYNKDQPQRREAAEQAAAQQAQREAECRQAREQLAFMDTMTARRLQTTDEQGNVARVTEDQFQQRRAELLQVIDQRC